MVHNHLDDMVTAALEAGKDTDAKALATFGSVHLTTTTVKVIAYALCRWQGTHSAVAVAGCYWGPGSQLNAVERVHGEQAGIRADLWSIAIALYHSPLNKSLEIGTHSQYCVNAVVYHSVENEMCGWKGKNGDLLHIINTLIKRCTAPVSFLWLGKTEATQNGHWKAAVDLAKAALSLPLADRNVHPFFSLPHMPVIMPQAPTLNVKKVTSKTVDPRHNTVDKAKPPTREKYPHPHRGHAKMRALQEENRRRLMETESVGQFWCTFHKLTDPVPETPLVSADALAHVFEQWLNPPEVLPPGFDAAQHKMNAMLASYMPSRTVDHTPEGFFSLHFNEEEVTDFKEDIRSHMDSAAADDRITYLDIMDIPNDLLMEIFNTCLDECDAPAEWIRIALVGVLKHGKTGSDPEAIDLLEWRAVCFDHFPC